MRRITHSGKRWSSVNELATRQHGVVSRRQLRALGISDSSIEKAVIGRRLHPGFRGTFGVGLAPAGNRARMMAAVLACGRGAVVSHLTAAHLLGLRDPLPASIEVIAPRASGRGIDGIRRRHVPLPNGSEAGQCEAIPCTSPSRTIVDLAGILSERSLRRTVERAAVLRMLDAPSIERSLSERRRRGAPTLRAILSPWRSSGSVQSVRLAKDPPHLRSELETRLFALIRASDLPTPACNHRIAVGDGNATLEVDFLWPTQSLVVEADGRDFHDNPLAFERDRKRDRELQSSGYRVIRFTHRQIEREPVAVIAAIRRLLTGDFG
jgi:very-short-patch-repair endonuclease